MLKQYSASWVHEPSFAIPSIDQYDNEDMVELDEEEADPDEENSEEGDQILESCGESHIAEDDSPISKRPKAIEDKQDRLLSKLRQFVNASDQCKT